jgi:hypothetical protein
MLTLVLTIIIIERHVLRTRLCRPKTNGTTHSTVGKITGVSGAGRPAVVIYYSFLAAPGRLRHGTHAPGINIPAESAQSHFRKKT